MGGTCIYKLKVWTKSLSFQLQREEFGAYVIVLISRIYSYINNIIMRYFDCLSDKQTAGRTYNKKKHSKVCPKKDTYLFTSGAFTLMPCGVNSLFSKNDLWYNIHHGWQCFSYSSISISRFTYLDGAVLIL